jgi:RNA polymerase sigma factor (sigma-70 family)
MTTGQLGDLVQHLRTAVLLDDEAGPTDAQLLGRFVDHRDEDAFAALVRKHAPMVWGVCHRLLPQQDAEDAFQATFLVLLRKAASFTPRPMVANWLYGVAHRTSLKARTMVAKRRHRERQVAEMPEPATEESDLWNDLRPVIDQELSHLPDKHRAVIILCELEGKTRKEAARQLGIPEGTVASRLNRGRTMLAQRLTRLGIPVSGIALATVLSRQSIAATVPPSLARTAAQTARILATGGTAASSIISAHAVALSEGVMKAMVLTKAGIGLIAFAMIATSSVGSGALFYHTKLAKAAHLDSEPGSHAEAVLPEGEQTENNGRQGQDQPKHALEKRKLGRLQGARVAVSDGQTKPARHAASDTKKGSWPRKFSGRVTDSVGSPIGQAKIFLVGPYSSASGTMPMGLREVDRSDAQGNFAFEITGQAAEEQKLDEPGGTAEVVAQAPGYGLASLTLEAFDIQPVDSSKRERLQLKIDQDYGAGRFAERTLKLRPEQPIHGRLLDLEGRPLTNVMVSTESISEVKIETLLKAFEKSDKRLMYQSLIPIQISLDPLQRLFRSVKTDSSGRFTLRGVAKDQLLTLTFQGEGVEAARIYVVGRKMQPARLPQIEHYSNGYHDFYGGCDFTYALGPSAPVIGVVKDCDTGQPIPNTIVFVERLFAERGERNEQVRLSCRYIRTITDQQGSFRIVGIPPGGPHVLRAVPPIQEPYLMAERDISPKLDGSHGLIDIRVKKGLWYEGRVTDKASGKAVRAHVDHLALQSNPNKLENFDLRQGWEMARYPTDNDGRYRTLGLPGPGVLLIRAMELDGYPRAIGGDKVPGYRASINYIPTTPVGMPLVNWNLIIQVNPTKSATAFHRDIVLDAGEAIPGRLVAPDGRPLSDVQVVGETLNNTWWVPHRNAEFQLKGYDGKGPRQLLFRASEGSLVGQYRLEGPAPKKILVKLEPAVRVRGRLIEREADLPAERCQIYCEKSTIGEAHITASTDDDGRFEIKGLVARAVYKMSAANSKGFFSNKNKFEIDLKQARPGDLIDLGDIGRATSKKP